MAWDHEERDCPQCGRKIKGLAGYNSHLKWHAREQEKAAGEPAGNAYVDEDAEKSPGDAKVKGKGFFAFLKGENVDKAKKPIKPKVVHKREHTGEIGQLVWLGAARAVGTHDKPVARVLAMQAPYVGEAFEEAVKGHAIDKLVQPVARANAKAEGLGALVGVPILVGAWERMPEARPMIEPMLRQLMIPMLLQLARGAKAERRREEEAAAAMEEIADLFDPEILKAAADAGLGPVDMLFDIIFTEQEVPA